MPRMERDPESGALVFHQTPEELALKQAQDDIRNLTKLIVNLNQRVQKLETGGATNGSAD